MFTRDRWGVCAVRVCCSSSVPTPTGSREYTDELELEPPARFEAARVRTEVTYEASHCSEPIAPTVDRAFLVRSACVQRSRPQQRSWVVHQIPFGQNLFPGRVGLCTLPNDPQALDTACKCAVGKLGSVRAIELRCGWILSHNSAIQRVDEFGLAGESVRDLDTRTYGRSRLSHVTFAMDFVRIGRKRRLCAYWIAGCGHSKHDVTPAPYRSIDKDGSRRHVVCCWRVQRAWRNRLEVCWYRQVVEPGRFTSDAWRYRTGRLSGVRRSLLVGAECPMLLPLRNAQTTRERQCHEHGANR